MFIKSYIVRTNIIFIVRFCSYLCRIMSDTHIDLPIIWVVGKLNKYEHYQLAILCLLEICFEKTIIRKTVIFM